MLHQRATILAQNTLLLESATDDSEPVWNLLELSWHVKIALSCPRHVLRILWPEKVTD